MIRRTPVIQPPWLPALHLPELHLQDNRSVLRLLEPHLLDSREIFGVTSRRWER